MGVKAQGLAEVNPYLRWYSRVVWFGAFANLAFCLTAWFAPERILKLLRLRQTSNNVWLRNVGMLLVNLSLFNAVAALDPHRYPLFAWSVPVARLIAGIFFRQVSLGPLQESTERPRAFIPLMVFDFTMAILGSALLWAGRPRSKKYERSVYSG